MASDKQLQQWFDRLDTNKSGEIECEELHDSLTSGNLFFSSSTVAHLIRLHNKNRGPSLNFQEFRNLHKFLADTQTSFTNANPINGVLSYKKLDKVLRAAGYNFEDVVFKRILEAFDPESRREIDLTAFIRLTMFFHSASATFTAFDPAQTGSITLDFNQFLYAASNVI